MVNIKSLWQIIVQQIVKPLIYTIDQIVFVGGGGGVVFVVVVVLMIMMLLMMIIIIVAWWL